MILKVNDQDAQQIMHILEEIRENQKLQLKQQADALTLQREQFAITQKQTDRTERIQDRAEQIQAKSAQLVSGSRKAMLVILPVILILIGYVSWLFFHYVARWYAHRFARNFYQLPCISPHGHAAPTVAPESAEDELSADARRRSVQARGQKPMTAFRRQLRVRSFSRNAITQNSSAVAKPAAAPNNT